MSGLDEDDWQQVRTYTDHLGHRVVLKQFVELGFLPDNAYLIPIVQYYWQNFCWAHAVMET